ncbi:Cys-tRNA(Pro) deacylase [Millisia brevis]|uniref:Cys-tRNA(Pro) deacylase n=1 Tax=Millisia brevis TaxID=264148 RepID=UPI00082A9896|nr:Cys-tRNA(Pro) deacylase [Millisia brevis]
MAARTTPATTALTRRKVTFRIHSYTHDPAVVRFGAEAVTAVAEPLGYSPARVFKTLVVDTAPNGAPAQPAIAVVPVTTTLSLKAVAAALGARRATMADRTVAERTTGYVLGGISPVGSRRRLPTVIDASALTHPTVLVSGGRRGLEIEVAPGDLVAAAEATVADIAAPPSDGGRNGLDPDGSMEA